MTDLRTATRFLCIGLCTAALAACGDDQNDSTAGDATATESGTSVDPDTSGSPTSNPTSESNTEPTTGDEGTIGGTGMSMSSSGETGDTTMVMATVTETDPTTLTTTDPNPVCGDGVMEGTEECDDGNQDPGDGCEENCTISAVCGNGDVESGEVCDDGNTRDGDNCSADCQTDTTPSDCGDGVTQAPEECDDGNDVDGDGCETDCTLTADECGNGEVEGLEQCDDGNDIDGGPTDFCKNDCTVFVPPQCQAPADYIVCDDALNLMNKMDKTQAHKAMGICNDLDTNSVKIANFTFTAPDNESWQIAKGFGTFAFDDDMDPNTPDNLLYSPREGDAFLILSTGNISAPNNMGIVTEANNSQGGNGDNSNPDVPDAMPAPLTENVGSNNGAGGTPFMQCDGVGDCSDTLFEQWVNIAGGDPNDKLFFRFNTTVPAGTFGYQFDFVFCSAEWPVWVDTSFNDMFIVWQTDPSPDDPNQNPPVDPYTGNVTFIPDPNNMMQGLPLTITALDSYYAGPGYSGNEPQLAGTGFQTNACSDWFTAKGGVQPGADLNIGFFLTDMGDTALATMAIVDNFRWDCEGCVPSEVDDCGVQEPQ
jgi:cysteine-rich repeat protein